MRQEVEYHSASEYSQKATNVWQIAGRVSLPTFFTRVKKVGRHSHAVADEMNFISEKPQALQLCSGERNDLKKKSLDSGYMLRMFRNDNYETSTIRKPVTFSRQLSGM